MQNKSIWGHWWEKFRKWFYPAWLIYETSVRFLDYAFSVHQYFLPNNSNISNHLGSTTSSVLGIFSGGITFIICSVFLTVPTSYILYKFFTTPNLTGSKFERRIKPIF